MKVLIVNTILMGDKSATGTTMKNMLYKMPDVEFRQYCIDYRIKDHAQLVDTIFMDIKDAYIDKVIAKLKKKKNSVDNHPKAVISQAQNASGFGEFLHGMVDCWPAHISKENWKYIREFAPDLIYTMGGGIRVMNQAIKIARRLRRPIVFHCMDDWRSTMYTGSALSRPFNKVLNHQLKKIHKYCKYNLGIGKKMAEYYTSEYGVPYSYASNCVFEFNDIPYQSNNDDCIRIIFSGGLHFHRGETLLEVAALIEQLNLEGMAFELEVFAPPKQVQVYQERFQKFEHTKLFPYVPQEEQAVNLKRADILLHVESFENTDIEYMKYSFSTKLVEYFAVGRAVIGLGSKELASIEYIAERECGWTADTIASLSKVLKTVYQKADMREQYSRNALNVAKGNHSQKAIQDRIYQLFCDVVK